MSTTTGPEPIVTLIQMAKQMAATKTATTMVAVAAVANAVAVRTTAAILTATATMTATAMMLIAVAVAVAVNGRPSAVPAAIHWKGILHPSPKPRATNVTTRSNAGHECEGATW